MSAVLIALFMVIVSALLEDETKSVLRGIARCITRSSARRLPDWLRARYEEEWLADIGDRETSLRQFLVSLGFLVSAERIKHEYCLPSVPFRTALMMRTFDALIALLYLTLVLPIFLLCTIGVAALSGFPLLYRYRRIGRLGTVFWVYRFRSTSTTSHEAERGWHRPTASLGAGFLRFIRRTGVDTLPMLFSLLKGHLALVGPEMLSPPRGAGSTSNAQALRLRPGVISFRSVAVARGQDTVEGIDAVRLQFENEYSLSTSCKMAGEYLWFSMKNFRLQD